MYGETFVILVLGPVGLMSLCGVIQGALAAMVKCKSARIRPLLPLPILTGAATVTTVAGICMDFGWNMIGWAILFLWAVGAWLGALLGTIIGTLIGARIARNIRKRKGL